MTSLGEGQTQANREISHSMYLKTGDPGPQGGGTYTGESNENTLKMYENIFGPAGRDIKLDQQRHKRHQRWHLPDALKGSNQYLTDRVDGLITDSTNSPFTRNILPYVYLENPDQKLKWNVYSFDEGVASRVPYEAAARVLPQSKRSFAGYTVRQGLAIAMEHNFMMSAAGRENFRNQLTQLVGSIQMTNDIDVTVALLTAPSHQRHMDEKYKDTSRTTTQHCRQFVDLFGIMQKVPNALDILIEDAKNNLKSWGSAPPTFMLTNSALTTQLTMLPEKTNYLTNGPDGKKLLAQGPDLPAYRGLSFIPTRKFSLDSGEAPRDLLRRRVRVAEYHRIPYKPGIETQEFEFYDQSRDSFFRLSYRELLKLSEMHSESGDNMDVDGPNGPNGPNGRRRREYGSGSWSMQADKKTKEMTLTGVTDVKSAGFTTAPVDLIIGGAGGGIGDQQYVAPVFGNLMGQRKCVTAGAIVLPNLIFDQEQGKCHLPIMDPSKSGYHLNIHDSDSINYSGGMLLQKDCKLYKARNCRSYSEQFGGGLFNENLTKNAVDGAVERGWDLMGKDENDDKFFASTTHFVGRLFQEFNGGNELQEIMDSIEDGRGKHAIEAAGKDKVDPECIDVMVGKKNKIEGESKDKLISFIEKSFNQNKEATEVLFQDFEAHLQELRENGTLSTELKEFAISVVFLNLAERGQDIVDKCIARVVATLVRWAHDIFMGNLNGNSDNYSQARHDFHKIKDDLLLHATLNTLSCEDKNVLLSDISTTTRVKLPKKQLDFATNIMYHFTQKLPYCPNIHVNQRIALQQQDYESPCGINPDVLILQHLAGNIEIDQATCDNLMSDTKDASGGVIREFFQVKSNATQYTQTKLAQLVFAEFGTHETNSYKHTQDKIEEIQHFACELAKAVRDNSFVKHTDKIWGRFARIIEHSPNKDSMVPMSTAKADRFQYVIPNYVPKHKNDHEFCGDAMMFFERPLYDFERAYLLDRGSKFTSSRPTKALYATEAAEYYGHGKSAMYANFLHGTLQKQAGSTVHQDGTFAVGSEKGKIAHNYVPATVKYPWLSTLKGNAAHKRVVPQIIVTAKKQREGVENEICGDDNVEQAARWIEDNAEDVYRHFLLCMLERFFRDGARHLHCHSYLHDDKLYHMPISLKHGPELPYCCEGGDPWDNDPGSAGGLGGAYGKQDIVILRPNIEHEMLGVVMGRGGTQELGSTFWGQTELSCYDDAQHGIWGMSYKYHERAIVTNERNLIRVYDVAFDGYNGGMDQKVLDWNSRESLVEFRNKTYDRTMPYHGPSMVVMSFPHNPNISNKSWPNPVVFHPHGVTSPNPEKGPLPADIGEHNVFTSSNPALCDQAIEAKFKRYLDRLDMHYWVGVEQESRPAGEMCLSNEASQNLLAFEGTMRTYNHEGRMVHETHGSGHLGPSYVGVASVREGRGVQNANAAPTMHRMI